MNKQVILILILFFLRANMFATAQIPDFLEYKGKTYKMHTNPLDYYFTKDNPRPKDFGKFRCTACWRGYVAIWELKNKILYLKEVLEGDNHGPDILKELFKDSKGPVKAIWYSGTVSIPQGKRLKYVHMGYRSKYEKELKLQFEKGKLIKEWTIENKAQEAPPPMLYSNAKIENIKIEYNIKKNNMSGILVKYTISPPTNGVVGNGAIYLIIETRDGKKAPLSGDEYKLWTKNKDSGVKKWINIPIPLADDLKGSLFFPWTALSLPKGKHELTGIVQLKDLSKIISEKRFDFWYESKGLPPKAEAKIEKVWVTQNEKYKSSKGFFIHIKFKTKFMHVRDSVRIRVYLTNKEGKDLLPLPPSGYNLSEDKFGRQKWINPRYINAVYKDLKLFFCYKALPLPEGSHDLIAHVEIYDASKDSRESFATKSFEFKIKILGKIISNNKKEY